MFQIFQIDFCSDPPAIPAFYRAVFDIPEEKIPKIILNDYYANKPKFEKNEKVPEPNPNQPNILRLQELQDMITTQLNFNEITKLADAADQGRSQDVVYQTRFKLTHS